MGFADENTKFVATHFLHNGFNVIYEKFTAITSKEGLMVWESVFKNKTTNKRR